MVPGPIKNDCFPISDVRIGSDGAHRGWRVQVRRVDGPLAHVRQQGHPQGESRGFQMEAVGSLKRPNICKCRCASTGTALRWHLLAILFEKH
jgi:hypothetical protein